MTWKEAVPERYRHDLMYAARHGQITEFDSIYEAALNIAFDAGRQEAHKHYADSDGGGYRLGG